jgi:hypothetical protein
MKTLTVENRRSVFVVKLGRTSIFVAKELVSREGYLVLSVASMLRGKRIADEMRELIMELWNACDMRLSRKHAGEEYNTRRVLVWNTLCLYMGWKLAPAVCEVTQAHKEIVEGKMEEMFEGHKVLVGQYGGKYIVVDGRKHYIGTETGRAHAKAAVKPVEDVFFGKKVIVRRFIEVDGLEYEVTTNEDQAKTLEELKNNLVGDVLVDGAVEPVDVEEVVEVPTVVDVVEEVVPVVEVPTVVDVVPVVDVVQEETFEGHVVRLRKRTRFIVISGVEYKVNTEKQRALALKAVRSAVLFLAVKTAVDEGGQLDMVRAKEESAEVFADEEVDLWG